MSELVHHYPTLFTVSCVVILLAIALFCNIGGWHRAKVAVAEMKSKEQ